MEPTVIQCESPGKQLSWVMWVALNKFKRLDDVNIKKEHNQFMQNNSEIAITSGLLLCWLQDWLRSTMRFRSHSSCLFFFIFIFWFNLPSLIVPGLVNIDKNLTMPNNMWWIITEAGPAKAQWRHYSHYSLLSFSSMSFYSERVGGWQWVELCWDIEPHIS